MVGTRLLGAALVASMALLAGCRESAPRATPTATTPAPVTTSTASATAAPNAAQPTWDARAVTAKPEGYFRIPCPAATDPARGNPGQVLNMDTPAAAKCVDEAMQATGTTTEEARAFVARYRTFLVGFEERGRVDLGTTSAAWVNMGRPEPVFVNAGPDGMLSLQALVNGGAPNQPAKTWLARPDVVAALRGQTDVIAWAEYARVTSIDAPGGRQRFLAAIPVRACRACATLLDLQVAFEFGPAGELLGAEPRPPVVATGTATGSSGAQESGHAPGLPSRQP